MNFGSTIDTYLTVEPTFINHCVDLSSRLIHAENIQEVDLLRLAVF